MGPDIFRRGVDDRRGGAIASAETGYIWYFAEMMPRLPDTQENIKAVRPRFSYRPDRLSPICNPRLSKPVAA